jgi:hypothetical protein
VGFHLSQRDLVHGLQLAVHAPDQHRLEHGGGHQDAGGVVDVGHLVGDEKQQDGEEVDQEFHADAPFGGSARRAQRGSKSNEAEFMQ